MTFLRKAIFYLFCLIYLIVCPVTILYALGYILAPQTDEGFIKTGLIYIETLPSDASIYLNGKRYKQKTPAMIPHLHPGEYTVEIRHRQYRPWQATVQVEAGKAAVLERVLLISQQMETLQIAEGPYRFLAGIPRTRFLIFGNDRLESFSVYDWKEKKIFPLLVPGSPSGAAEVDRVFIRENSPHVLVRSNLKGEERYEWFRIDEEGSEPVNLTPAFREKEPADVFWHPEKDEYLFMLYDGELDRIHLETGQTATRFMKDLQGLGVFENKLYAVRENTLIRHDYGSAREEVLVRDEHIMNLLFRPGNFYRMERMKSDTFVFYGKETGRLVTNRLPYILAEEGIEGYRIHPRERKMLVWTGDRIGVVDFERIRSGGIFEEGPSIQWMKEQARGIHDVFWVYEDAYAMYRDSRGVYLLALSSHMPPSEEKVLDAGRPVYYAEETGWLYYLDEAQQLAAVRLMLEESGLLRLERMTQEAVRTGKRIADEL